MSAEHTGFTREEATQTLAGEVRAIILWEIASRCGQVPDVHPRLLEGIEVAARRIAAEVVTGVSAADDATPGAS